MRTKLILLLFIMQILIFPKLVFAATFSLVPNQGSLTPQTTIPIEIRLSSTDAVNIVSTVINYPEDLLDIAWIKTDTSAFGVEVEQFANNGQIRISRGGLTPVSGPDVNIATFGITPKASGNAVLSFTDSSTAISSTDMNNVLNLASSTGASFSIVAQAPSPSPPPSTSAIPTASPPTPSGAVVDTKCQQAADTLKSKLVNKYKSISKTVFRLDTISTLTANYYQTKLMPKGRLLPGYYIFNNQIKDTRQTALIRLSSLQNIANNFSCSNPTDQIENFKSEVVTLKKTLMDYRQANTDLLIRFKGL